MDGLLHGWPLLTPLLAALLLAWSFLEPRVPGSGPRRHDPAFLLPLLWPMYLLHQFEEHGVDLRGERYAFLGAMCRTLGFDALPGCPADEAFIFAVNVIACPLAFGMPYVFRRTRPVLAAVPWGVPLVNGVAHGAAAMLEGAYNPGLLTGVVLFLPLTLWVLHVLVRRGGLRPAHVGLTVASGVALHAVLFGSVQLRSRGWMGATGLFLINALNGLVPWALGGAFLWKTARPVPDGSPRTAAPSDR
jgi:hypothetical protein